MYIKDLEKFKNNNWSHYLTKLNSLGIIQNIRIKSNVLNYLIDKYNYGQYHIDRIKFYNFSKLGLEFFGTDEIKELIYENASKEVIKKVHNDITEFKQFEHNKKLREEEQKKYNANRYRILNNIPYRKRSMKQQFFIDDYNLNQ